MQKKLSIYDVIHCAQLSYVAHCKNSNIVSGSHWVQVLYTWVTLLKAPSGGTWCVYQVQQHNIKMNMSAAEGVWHILLFTFK